MANTEDESAPCSVSVDNLFLYKELLTYNQLFRKYVIFECECYDRHYRSGISGNKDHSSHDGSAFERYIFRQRNSYLACVSLGGGDHPITIKHLLLPIILGSAIDLAIRQHCGLEPAHRFLFGGYLINGSLKIIPNFITNNTRHGCVRFDRKKGTVDYRMTLTSPNQLTLKLIFNQEDELNVQYEDEHQRISKLNEYVTLPKGTRRKRTFVPRSEYSHDEHHKSWIDHVHECSPLEPSEEAISESEYCDLFRALMQHTPKLDDLCNKTVVSGVVTLYRAFEYVMDKLLSPLATPLTLTKLRSIFIGGNMFMVLSSTLIKLGDTISADYNRTVYQDVDAEKLDSVCHEMSLIRRVVRNSTKNSDALNFPDDGEDFLCPVSIKEMVGAGETLFFALFAMCSPAIPAEDVMKLLRLHGRYCRTQPPPGASSSSSSRYCCRRVVVGAFLTNFWIDETQMMTIKRANTFLLFRDAGPHYIVISHHGCIPVKYSPKYDVFLSPYEAHSSSWYPGAFEDYCLYAKMSVYGLQFSDHFVRAQPQKLAVSITNFRGSAANITSSLMAAAFMHHIGSNSALLQVKGSDPQLATQFFDEQPQFTSPVWNRQQYSQLAVMNEDEPEELRLKNMPDILKRLYGGWPQTTTLSTGTEFEGTSFDDVLRFSGLCAKVTMAKVLAHIHNVLPATPSRYRIFDPQHNRARKQPPEICSVGSTNAGLYLVKTAPPVTLKLDTSLKSGMHFSLYTMFGDIGGGTNEDGLVLDSKTAENGPRHMSVACSVVTFHEHCDDLRKVMNREACALRYQPIGAVMKSQLIVGMIESRRRLQAAHSKIVFVCFSPIGRLYRYIIVVNDLSCQRKVLSSFLVGNSVYFAYVTVRKLGIGTKVTSKHGQKGIISKVQSLESCIITKTGKKIQCFGYTRTGKKVHAQILNSTTSLLARTTVSQLQSMLTDPEAAFTPEGYLIARVGYLVHNIDAGAKVRANKPKIDLMTSENGYHANSMSSLAKVQAEQSDADLQQPGTLSNQLQVVFNLFAMQGIRIEFIQ